MTLHLVRHADAGPGPDEGRRLTAAGQRRADQIVGVLADAGVARVLTSRYVRCVETVTPLAERLGVALEVHPALAEEAGLEDAWALLESLAAVDAVVCSHGNLLSPLLDRILRRGADVTGEWLCRKGSIWRLDADGDRSFARAELLP